MSGKNSPTRREFLMSAGLGTTVILFDRKHQQYINAFNPGLRLWYRNPAPDWNEALPLGNGRIGAMLFGGIETEHLQLNENTLYSEEPGHRDLKLDLTKDYDRVQAMLQNRQYAEASDFITKNWLGRGQPCYQPLGDLYLYIDEGGGDLELYP